jgi:hypothetical protein
MRTYYNNNRTLVKKSLALLLMALLLLSPAAVRANEDPLQLHPDRNPSAVDSPDAPTSAETVLEEAVEEAVEEALAETIEAVAPDPVEEAPGEDLQAGQEEAISVQPPAPPPAPPVTLQIHPGYWESSPLPAQGLAMYYNPGLMEQVLDYRLRMGNVTECEECIGYVALLRAGDIDRRVWMQRPGEVVEGPFWVIDVAARHDIPSLLERDWVVDIDYETAMRWGMRGPVPVTVLSTPGQGAGMAGQSGVVSIPPRGEWGQLALDAGSPITSQRLADGEWEVITLAAPPVPPSARASWPEQPHLAPADALVTLIALFAEWHQERFASGFTWPPLVSHYHGGVDLPSLDQNIRSIWWEP